VSGWLVVSGYANVFILYFLVYFPLSLYITRSYPVTDIIRNVARSHIRLFQQKHLQRTRAAGQL